MRTTAQRALAACAAAAALVMTATTAASAAAPAAARTSVSAPTLAAGWEWIGEFPYRDCVELRDSYAGSAKCVRNAGGLYDLYVLVA
ncbi:hypothetical protein [Streptomyces sp. NPDC047974]|uniref:hypothetical protein n=1 Tax=Streptomyces sp. NPDC047974 TaxID=3154343 RepID=UPI0033C874CA